MSSFLYIPIGKFKIRWVDYFYASSVEFISKLLCLGGLVRRILKQRKYSHCLSEPHTLVFLWNGKLSRILAIRESFSVVNSGDNKIKNDLFVYLSELLFGLYFFLYWKTIFFLVGFVL